MILLISRVVRLVEDCCYPQSCW